MQRGVKAIEGIKPDGRSHLFLVRWDDNERELVPAAVRFFATSISDFIYVLDLISLA